MSTQEPNSSCGDKVTLRELRERGNYIAISSQKWLRLFERMNGKGGFPPPQFTSTADYFSAYIGSILKPEDRGNSQRIINTFREALKRVKSDLNQRVKKFMPLEWHKDFCPLNGEKVPDDPLQFADCLNNIRDNSVIGRPEFEILRAIELAGTYFVINTQYDDWGEQATDIAEQKRLRAFLKYSHIPEEAVRKQSLDFYLDPGNEWRCRKAATEGASIGRYTPLLRQLRKSVIYAEFSSLFRKKVKAIVLTRKKGCLEAFARRFRDPQSELMPYVPDIYGVRLCYFNEDEMKSGINLMGICASVHSSSAFRIIPRLNKHSVKHLHLVSQKILMDGRYTEIQHMPVREWLDIEYSTARENHALYQLRWYSEKYGLFANIFPPEIYGKHWDKESVWQKMRDCVIENTRLRNEREAERLAQNKPAE